MVFNKKELTAEPVVEFSPGKDPYIKSRKKGATRWILAHLFHGSNKLFIIIIIFTIILSANLSSIIYIIIGQTISALLSGLTALLGNYILILFILGITGPILRIVSRMLIEINRDFSAEDRERRAKRVFYKSIRKKSIFSRANENWRVNGPSN